MIRSTGWRRLLGVAASCAVVSWGCAGEGPKADPALQAGGTGSANPPIIESMHRGIELHRLLDRPHRHKLEAILSRYSAEPLGLSEQQLEMWRREGLRIVAVPVDDEGLKALVLELTGEIVVERIRMGVVPEWRPAAAAPRIEGSKLVRVGGEIGSFVGGRFRLLLRAYPLLGFDPPLLRLELIVQFHQPKRDPFAPDALREERMGVYVPTSALALDLDGQWAVVVTAEDPSVLWSEATATGQDDPPKDGAPATPPDEEAVEGKEGATKEPRSTPPTPAGPGQGPSNPRIRTTGEETLISEDGETRFVLIFVPRLK